MEAGRITWHLDLIARLWDAASGKPAEPEYAAFLKDGREIEFIRKKPGVYILQNNGRQDFRFEIRAAGYETETADIRYGTLDIAYPLADIRLLPLPSPEGYPRVFTLEGNDEKLTRIEGVNLNAPLDFAKAYQKDRGVLKLRCGNSLKPEAGDYALLHADGTGYERLMPDRKTDRLTLCLKQPLQAGFSEGDRILRIIPGRLSAGGGYLLRFREEGFQAQYLICRTREGEDSFTAVDFNRINGKEENGIWLFQ